MTWTQFCHDWLGFHRWTGCRCSICGTISPDDRHDWRGCLCKQCSHRRNKDHHWDGDTCRNCQALLCKECNGKGQICNYRPLYDPDYMSYCGLPDEERYGADPCPSCGASGVRPLKSSNKPTTQTKD